MASCQVCGRSPAAQIKLRRNVGLVLAHRIVTANAVLCRQCADTATSEFQRETLIKGWTSPRSALMNPFTIAANAVRKSQHARRIQSELDESGRSEPLRSELGDSSDPSDLLLAWSGANAGGMRLLMDIVLDYQGGGINSSPVQIRAAQQIPTKRLQDEIKDTSRFVLEGLEAAGNNETAVTLVFAAFALAVQENASVSENAEIELHRVLARSTFDASRQLWQRRRNEDAIGVLALGQMLHANTLKWSAARSRRA